MNLIIMRTNWRAERIKESRGFVSNRIVLQIILDRVSVYGTSYTINYGTFTRILNPEDVVVEQIHHSAKPTNTQKGQFLTNGGKKK